MNGKYIVALDQGTSSCRAFAVDETGTVQAQKSVVFSPRRPAKGHSEYEATALLNAQQGVLQALLDELTPGRVAAIGVCSQRSTVVLWDKITGQVVAPVLTWEDGRAVQESAQIPFSQAYIHTRTGLFNTPYFSAPKIAWCLKNFPQAAHAAQEGTLAVSPVASYLIWHLTRGAVFATDCTLAQRTLLWNIQTGKWDDSLCRAFGVPDTCLPQVLPSAADYGSYLYKGVTIPICACVADQQAAAFYQGLSAGQTAINYGTGAFVLHHTGEQLSVLPGMLSSVAAGAQTGERAFLLEGPVFAAGSVLQWLQHVKGLSFEVEKMDEVCAWAQHPVQFLPALGGLGAPYWDYRVGPVAEEVTPQTTAADWVAGALTGIAGLVADILYYLQANGQKITSPVYVSGGLSQSRYLLQSQADLGQITLQVRPQAQSTVLGTTYLAAKGVGHLFKLPVSPGQTVSPALTASQTKAKYETWHAFVEKCRKQPS